jgi:hypothetical protein
MDFIQKHYEKAVLGVVLLLAAAAVASLPFLIAGERQALDDQRNTIIQKTPRPLTNLDLTLSDAVVQSLRAPLAADFTRPHNLVNPVPWQKAADGKLYKLEKGNEVGPEAALLTKTTPLFLVLTFDSVGPSSSGPPSGYLIGIEKQAAAAPAARRKKQTYATPNVKKEDTLTLRSFAGPPESPTNLVVELADTGELATITKEQPFRRVDGYLADLRYDPDKRTYNNRRVNDAVTIAGETYKIVAITEHEVVVSHPLTGKKSTIRKKTE